MMKKIGKLVSVILAVELIITSILTGVVYAQPIDEEREAIVEGTETEEPEGKDEKAIKLVEADGCAEDMGYVEIVEDEEEMLTASEQWLWPVPSSRNVTQGFRPSSNPGHDGIDIGAAANATMVAAKSGTVVQVYSGCKNHSGGNTGLCSNKKICSPNTDIYYSTNKNGCNFGFGNGCVVRADDGTYYSYAHLNAVYVTQGQHISQGATVGLAGDTGYSYGVHCHFEIASSASTSGSGWYNFTNLNPTPGVINYIYSANPTPSTIMANSYVSNITETTATINAELNDFYKVTECGYYFGTSPTNMTLASTIDHPTTNVKKIYYNLSGLSNGTTYYYNIYTIKDNIDYWTGVQSFTTAQSFTGCADGFISYPGLLAVSGWVFENVHPKELCYIDIYIGDDTNPYKTLSTGVSRTDVSQLYPQTSNNQGFYGVFDTKKYGTGDKLVRVFAVNKERTNWMFIGSKTVTLKANVPPTISDVKVSNITDSGYTVTCKVTDSLPEDIKSIQFRTTVNGTTSSYVNGSFNGSTGVATYNVDIKNFSNQTGTYQTEICATDLSGATTTTKASAVSIGKPITVNSHSLIVGGAVGLNFDMYIPQSIRNDGGAYVMINNQKFIVSEATKVGDLYRFTYKVNAKEMNDNCTLSVYDKNGKKINVQNSTAVNGSYVYSVAKYLNEIVSSSKDSNMVELAKAMRNYGNAAQIYFAYNTSNAGGITPYKTSDFSGYVPTGMYSLPDGLTYVGSSLLLNGQTSLRHYFNVDGKHSISDYKFKISNTDVNPVKKSDGLYYVTIADIPANKLSTTYKVTINNDYSINYSALSYAYKTVEKGDSDNLVQLMHLLSDYNKKAITYFGE